MTVVVAGPQDVATADHAETRYVAYLYVAAQLPVDDPRIVDQAAVLDDDIFIVVGAARHVGDVTVEVARARGNEDILLHQRYDEVGLPCSSTMGSPSPTSTYAISRPRTRRRFFWYGNAAVLPHLQPRGRCIAPDLRSAWATPTSGPTVAPPPIASSSTAATSTPCSRRWLCASGQINAGAGAGAVGYQKQPNSV